MRHITLRIIAALVLIAAIAGIALLAYNAGTAHQTAIAAQAPGSQTGVTTYPVYGWWPFPFFGFGFFGLLAAFFLISIALSALRLIFWGPRWGWRRWQHGYGYWGERSKDEQPPIPPMMAELHRRMHEAERGNPADQATQNQA